MKLLSDRQDIRFLLGKCANDGLQLDLTVDDQTLAESARNGLAIFLQGMQDAHELVEQVIKL
jgi:hypothetical protein